MALTEKQQRFVEEYLVDLNASQAAKRAGYSRKTAPSQGQRLLKNVEVSQAILEGQKQRSERTGVTQDQVIREIARLAFSDVRKAMTDKGALLDPNEWDDDFASAVASMEVVTTYNGETDEDGRKVPEHTKKIKMWDKNAALEKLAKHLGMYAAEKHEHSGKVDFEKIVVEFVGGPEG